MREDVCRPEDSSVVRIWEPDVWEQVRLILPCEQFGQGTDAGA